MKYEQLIHDILSHIGGMENIESCCNCATRLRFQLKDDTLPEDDEMKRIPGVLSVVRASGQYQVVIGTHVADVLKELEALMQASEKDMMSAEEMKQEVKKKKIKGGALDLISGVFTPVLGMLSAAGVLKGVLALLLTLGLLESSGGTYLILNVCANSFLYALPVFLGYTSSKKFGGTPFIGMGIGFALIYPSVMAAMSAEPLYILFANTIFESPVYIEFMGLPVILMDYSSSVIPVIVVTFFASHLEKWFDRHTNPMIKTFFVPMMTLLVSIPAAFLIIGPLTSWASNLLGEGALICYNISPIIFGFIYGMGIQVFVMLGLHWGFIAISLNNMATVGYDPITITGMTSVLAQGAVVLMIWLMTKNKELKSRCGAAFFPTLVGCSEPAIYGVTLHYKKVFAIACIFSGIGGAVMGAAGAKQYVFGTGGLLGFLQVINPATGADASVIATVIACIISFIGACLAMKLIGLKRLEVEEQ